MADWRLDQRTEETPVESDITILSRGTSTFKTTFKKIKDFIIGTTTLTTTDTTVTGAIEEVKGIADNNTTQLNENVNNITSIKSDKTFMFCNLSATTIATKGVCKISSISINSANWFELTSDGKLKCLVSGKYRFYCKAYINNAPVGRYELQLRRNETAVEIEMVNVTTTGSTTNRVFMLINAQQDQIIDVYLYQTSGSSVTISPDARFSKIYIERIGDL